MGPFSKIFLSIKDASSNKQDLTLLSTFCSRTLDSIPESVEARFRELSTQFGLDYDAMCVNDNTGCPY